MKAKVQEESVANQLKKMATDNTHVKIVTKHTATFIDLLLDYNSLEAMNLLFCALLLNIGIMFEGARSKIEKNEIYKLCHYTIVSLYHYNSCNYRYSDFFDLIPLLMPFIES